MCGSIVSRDTGLLPRQWICTGVLLRAHSCWWLCEVAAVDRASDTVTDWVWTKRRVTDGHTDSGRSSLCCGPRFPTDVQGRCRHRAVTELLSLLFALHPASSVLLKIERRSKLTETCQIWGEGPGDTADDADLCTVLLFKTEYRCAASVKTWISVYRQLQQKAKHLKLRPCSKLAIRWCNYHMLPNGHMFHDHHSESLLWTHWKLHVRRQILVDKRFCKLQVSIQRIKSNEKRTLHINWHIKSHWLVPGWRPLL